MDYDFGPALRTLAIAGTVAVAVLVAFLLLFAK